MRIAVIGAGVAGITTAYELACRHHEVHVFERRDGVAAEASFANGGILSAALAGWIGSGGLQPSLERKSAWPGATLEPRLGMRLQHWRWLRDWRRQRPTEGQTALRNSTLAALALLSQQRMQELQQELSLTHEQTRGVMVLVHQPEDAESANAQAQRWMNMGVPVEWLSAAACRQAEPALGGEQEGDTAPSPGVAGALWLPTDEVANCRQFVQQLRERAEDRLGLQVHFNVDVLALHPASPNSPARLQLARGTCADAPPAGAVGANGFANTTIEGRQWEESFDAIVICTGHHTQKLVDPLALKLPLRAVWGHSVTFRMRPDATPIQSAVVDPRAGITLSRHGDRLRVCGLFDLEAPQDTHGRPELLERTLTPLYDAVDRWFPHAVLRGSAQTWHGARAMLPDGLPAIGAAGAAGIWLNTGHGGLGWTLACGSARLLARQIEGKTGASSARPTLAMHEANIDSQLLAPERWAVR